MEDPITFDLFLKVHRGHNDEIVNWLKTDIPEIEKRKAVNKASINGDWLLVSKRIRWSLVHALKLNLPEWCRDSAVCQYGYIPEELYFCKKHKLYYGGCLGCHVCTGFYKK